MRVYISFRAAHGPLGHAEKWCVAVYTKFLKSAPRRVTHGPWSTPISLFHHHTPHLIDTSTRKWPSRQQLLGTATTTTPHTDTTGAWESRHMCLEQWVCFFSFPSLFSLLNNYLLGRLLDYVYGNLNDDERLPTTVQRHTRWHTTTPPGPLTCV